MVAQDGKTLLAVGTSSGDQHSLCAFEWGTGRLLARTVALSARPVGVFELLSHYAYPQRLTAAQAADLAKETAQYAVATGRAAARQGGTEARAAAERAAKAAEEAKATAERLARARAEKGDPGGTALIVVIGQVSSDLPPPPPRCLPGVCCFLPLRRVAAAASVTCRRCC